MRKQGLHRRNQKLREQRLLRQWSQQELAERVGTTVVTVNRWERGITKPTPHFRLKLRAVFGLPEQELGLTPELTQVPLAAPEPLMPAGWTAPRSLPLCYLPLRRNPYFTGREEVLRQLRKLLERQQQAVLTQVQAISGLGGIGKTQTALEYAYRARETYQVVLWARADTRSVLLDDLSAISALLKLPGWGRGAQEGVVQVIKEWLETHERWLLILDNVEDCALVETILPSDLRGHVLLTTRLRALGALAQDIHLEQMTPEEGALFLLRRAKLLPITAHLSEAPKRMVSHAKAIAHTLDGLPLALDQAGAYIEETGCSLSDYLNRYQHSRFLLLDQRGGMGYDHPQSVATTLMLSYAQVERENPTAAQLLRFCAFLDPEAIPEEIFFAKATESVPLFQKARFTPTTFDSTIAVLRKYSLIQRDPERKCLSMHRLVQAVLKDGLPEQEQEKLAAQAVRLICSLFPQADKAENLVRCQRYLPHALICAQLIERWQMTLPEASHLLNAVSSYLRECTQYSLAEHLARQLKTITTDPSLAESATNTDLFFLARQAYYRGYYNRVEPLIKAFQDEITRLEHTHGPFYRRIAHLLTGQAVLYHIQGKYSQAEPVYQRALCIPDKDTDAGRAHIAFTMSMLAKLYTEQGRYDQAQELFEQALAIWQHVEGQQYNLFLGPSLDGMAELLLAQGKIEHVEEYLQRELEVLEPILGKEHPIIADNHNLRARLYLKQGRIAAAEPLLRRALDIFESSVGLHHPFAANTLSLLARLFLLQGKVCQAMRHAQQALLVREQMLGEAHPETAESLRDLADLYRHRGDWQEAERLYQRALAIYESVFETDHPAIVHTRERYAALLSAVGREEHAL